MSQLIGAALIIWGQLPPAPTFMKRLFKCKKWQYVDLYVLLYLFFAQRNHKDAIWMFLLFLAVEQLSDEEHYYYNETFQRGEQQVENRPVFSK